MGYYRVIVVVGSGADEQFLPQEYEADSVAAAMEQAAEDKHVLPGSAYRVVLPDGTATGTRVWLPGI